MVPIACANSTGRPCKESFYRVEIPSHILHSRARNVLEEEIEHKKAIAKPASLAKFDKFQNHTTLSHSGTRKSNSHTTLKAYRGVSIKQMRRLRSDTCP